MTPSVLLQSEVATLPESQRSRIRREAKELLVRSRAFAHEIRWLSWWHFATTLAALTCLMALAASPLPLLLRLAASCFAGLTLVRVFILYHDFEHGAMLSGSKLAKVILQIFGLLLLNPPSVWKRSHDHHHKNNSKMFGTNIGSFPVMTIEAFRTASTWERFIYSVTRHPITILLGYMTVFLWGMCIRPLMLNPLRHADAALAIALHFGLVAVCSAAFGWMTAILVTVLPMLVASALGSYLFYAQHNFPGVKLREHDEWTYVQAALGSSSYIRMGAIMGWLTGNIGYHHVHHLNSRIPFYRLPEAMAAMKELQSPSTTTLHPREVLRCLRLKLWNPIEDQLVAFEDC